MSDEMAVKQDILDEIQGLPYAREVQNYLIDLASALTGKPKPPADFSYNIHKPSKTFVSGADIENVLQLIHHNFDQNGFSGPQDLEDNIIRTFYPDISPQALLIANRYNEHSLEPDHLTGYQQKAQVPLIMGLSALYAKVTGAPVSIAEIDYSNMRGTNDHFAKLLACAEGTGITPAIIAEAMSLTDQSSYIVASIIRNTFDEELKKIQDASHLDARTGGDEARVTAINTPVAECRRIATLAENLIEYATARMGLHDHIHTKRPLDEWSRGFGACSSTFPLTADGDFEGAIKTADHDIQKRKTKIGQDRLENQELLSLKPPFSGDRDLYSNPAKASAYLAHVFEVIAELRNELHMDTQPSRTLSALDKLGETRQADSLLTIPEIHNHFKNLMAKELREEDIVPTAAQQRALEIKTTAFPSIDYVTNTILAVDMPAITGASLRAIKHINETHNIQADPWIMGISAHNLAGLNETLGHEGANAVLHHITQDILRPTLHRHGIADDNFVISHMGGGEFRLLIQPVIPRNGELTVIDPMTMHQITKAIEADIDQLNMMPMNYILRREGVEADAAHLEKTFSTVLNPRTDVSPREDGITATIVTEQYSEKNQSHWHPGGQAVNMIGEALSSEVADRRASFIAMKNNSVALANQNDEMSFTLF